MTSQARALAAFALAVLLVMGNLNRLAVVVYSVASQDVSGDASRIVLSLLILAIAAAVLWLANNAATGAVAGGWDQHLGQAARLLALLGVAIAVVTVIAALAGHGPFVYSVGTGS